MPSDIEIARAAALKPIAQVAERLGIPDEALHPYGRHIAKLDHRYVAGLEARAPGKLVLVTAISPTPAGEGKTTTTIGLGDALNRIGKRRPSSALREPSLGPVLRAARAGLRAAATLAGRADGADQPALHRRFPRHHGGPQSAGLSACIDNHIYWGNALDIDRARRRLAACASM